MNDEMFHENEIDEMFRSNLIEPLEDLAGIEEVVLKIEALDHKVSFWKELKKKKDNDIASAIKDVSQRIDFFKKIILTTLEANGEKSLTFPGVCKVTRKKKPVQWEITDEEEFIKYLKSSGKYDQVVEFTPKIKKDEANKLCKQCEEKGKLPSGINKKNEEFTLTIQIPKESEIIPIKEDAKSSKKVSVTEENFDAIDFTR